MTEHKLLFENHYIKNLFERASRKVLLLRRIVQRVSVIVRLPLENDIFNDIYLTTLFNECRVRQKIRSCFPLHASEIEQRCIFGAVFQNMDLKLYLYLRRIWMPKWSKFTNLSCDVCPKSGQGQLNFFLMEPL